MMSILKHAKEDFYKGKHTTWGVKAPLPGKGNFLGTCNDKTRTPRPQPDNQSFSRRPFDGGITASIRL